MLDLIHEGFEMCSKYLKLKQVLTEVVDKHSHTHTLVKYKMVVMFMASF